MMISSSRRLVSVCLAALILLLAPGQGAYAAVSLSAKTRPAQTFAAPLKVGRLRALSSHATLPRITRLPFAPPLREAPGAAKTASALAIGAVAANAAETLRARPTQARAPCLNLPGAVKKVTSLLEETPVLRAPAESVRSLGRDLEETLLGTGALRRRALAFFPAGGYFSQPGRFDSGPADLGLGLGQGQETPPPAPPAPRLDGGGSNPFLPRLLASVLALVPAGFLGLPLLASGASAAGSLLIGSSAGLALLPFFGDKTPGLLRRTPGLLLAALGALTLVQGHPWVGTLTALGGWGLARFGSERTSSGFKDDAASLSAFFGALGAIGLAGLAVLGPAGLLWAALRWALAADSALLFASLPGWFGRGFKTALRGLWLHPSAFHRVLASMRADTQRRKRLHDFSRSLLERSKFALLPLAFLWIPVLTSDLLQRVLSLAAGLLAAAALTPAAFLWGAAWTLSKEGRANRFLASLMRRAFELGSGSKIRVYNPLARRLIPLVDSRKPWASWPAWAALRLAQYVWLLYALAASAVLPLAGLPLAWRDSAGPYDEEKHDPAKLRVDLHDTPDTSKDDEEDSDKKGGSPLPLKLLASGLAAALSGWAAWLLLAAGSPLAAGVALLGAALAFLPFIPANAPRPLKRLFAAALGVLGLAGAWLAPWLSLPFWGGLYALLASWGMGRALSSKEKGPEDSAHLLAGALGLNLGLAGLWLAPGGWLWGALTALSLLGGLLLLAHLPRWVGRGLLGALSGLGRAASGLRSALSFWTGRTEFYENLVEQRDFWMRKSRWNAAWLSVVWVPTGLVLAVEWVLSAALGLAFGVVKAAPNFVAAALAEAKPRSKAARFAEAFSLTLERNAEDSWDSGRPGQFLSLGRALKPLIPAMNASSGPSGRPSFKAAAAFAAARLIQVLWLVAIVVATPLSVASALREGARAARR